MSASVQTADRRTARLRRGTVGTPGMIFMTVAATAPLTAMSSNISLSLGLGVGPATVGVLLLIPLIFAVYAVGYLVLSRYVTCAGVYQEFVAFGLGRRAGAAIAFVAALGYNLGSIGMIVGAGFFAAFALDVSAGVSVPWWVLVAVALVIVYGLGVRGVAFAKRITTAVSLLQFVLVAVFVVAVATQRSSGWTTDVLSPTDMFGPGVGLTIVLCLLCYASFETAAVYGEELAAPRRQIAAATYGTLALLVVVFVAGTWAVTAAIGDVQAVAAQDPGALVVTAIATYLGEWTVPVVLWILTVSFLSAGIAFHQVAVRYLFSLGRNRLLPSALSAVHQKHGTPHVACATQVGLAVLVVTPFVVGNLDPLTALFPAVGGISAIVLLVLMISCCVSIVGAARRGAFTESWPSTVLAPVVAGLALVAALVIIVANYSTVAGSDSTVFALMPLVIVVAAGYGLFAAGRQEATPHLDPDITSLDQVTVGSGADISESRA